MLLLNVSVMSSLYTAEGEMRARKGYIEQLSQNTAPRDTGTKGAENCKCTGRKDSVSYKLPLEVISKRR